MSDHIEIRRYRPEDAQAVVSLVKDLQRHELQFYDRMLSVDEIGTWYVNRILRESQEAGGGLIVAVLNKTVRGYATLFTRISSESAYDETLHTYAYVGDLVVMPSERGKGIGKKLLQSCEEMAREAGQKWLRINVLATNVAAHRLYETMGFRNRFVTLEKPLA